MFKPLFFNVLFAMLWFYENLLAGYFLEWLMMALMDLNKILSSYN